MTELLRERIVRKLETLADDRLYMVLDYVEFLESKYAARQNPSGFFARLKDTVEDRMREGRVSAAAIGETLGLLNKAMNVLNGVAEAGKSVASDIVSVAKAAGPGGGDVAGPPSVPPPGAPAGSAAPRAASPPPPAPQAQQRPQGNPPGDQRT
jgi:hypothetical protein